MKTKWTSYLDNSIGQYTIGLLLNISFLLILIFSSPASFNNIQMPEGAYAHNIWELGTDCMSYVQPAANYLKYGVFGVGTVPDNFRTIGYPAYIAMTMKLFGANWLYGLYFINCILFAFIYPIITSIASSFIKNKSAIRWIFLFSLLSGAYLVKVVYIGTDLFFSFFLLLGLYYIVKHFTTGKSGYLWLYLIAISIAAQVRPSLIFFFIINIIIFCFLKDTFHYKSLKAFVSKVILTSLILIVTCNLPSVRNYYNYKWFEPSWGMEGTWFYYGLQKTLIQVHQEDKYTALLAEVNREPNFKIRMKLQKQYAIEGIKEHPLAALKVFFIENVQNVFFDNHLVNGIGNFYGYNWKAIKPSDYNIIYNYQKSSFLFVCYYIMALIYLCLYILFGFFLFHLLKKKKWWMLIFFVCYIGMFILPCLIGGSGGARYRLEVEWLIVIGAMYQVSLYLARYKEKRLAKTQL